MFRNSKPWEGADVVIDPGVGARLASALAARLATRVPPNVEVSQVGGTLWVTDGRRSSGTPLDFILTETPPPAVGMTGIHAATESSGTSPPLQETHPPSSDLAVQDVRDLVLVAATNALSRLQDFLSETLTLPWPASPEGSSGGALPELEVRWMGSDLAIWFGDPDRPALALPPIPEDEFLPT